LIKSSGATKTAVSFQGKIIDLTKVPAAANYTEPVANANPGAWVGYVFTGEDGNKSAVILNPPAQ
jgi:hypothetical protein